MPFETIDRLLKPYGLKAARSSRDPDHLGVGAWNAPLAHRILGTTWPYRDDGDMFFDLASRLTPKAVEGASEKLTAAGIDAATGRDTIFVRAHHFRRATEVVGREWWEESWSFCFDALEVDDFGQSVSELQKRGYDLVVEWEGKEAYVRSKDRIHAILDLDMHPYWAGFSGAYFLFASADKWELDSIREMVEEQGPAWFQHRDAIYVRDYGNSINDAMKWRNRSWDWTIAKLKPAE